MVGRCAASSIPSASSSRRSHTSSSPHICRLTSAIPALYVECVAYGWRSPLVVIVHEEPVCCANYGDAVRII
eukprot:scaffold73729_cov41-Tisochrysis_lutea.AAC.1